MRSRIPPMAVALRSITVFLLMAFGTALRAQYVQDIGPKCPFATLRDYRMWSPDCHAYFVPRHFGEKTLNEELRSANGPQGAPFIPVVFTTPPDAHEHWWIRENAVEYVAHDPTVEVREDIVERCLGCTLMTVLGTRWLDSERMVLIATVANLRGEVYQLQYAVVAKSGQIIHAPDSWHSSK
jgi:hypothetical protein